MTRASQSTAFWGWPSWCHLASIKVIAFLRSGYGLSGGFSSITVSKDGIRHSFRHSLKMLEHIFNWISRAGDCAGVLVFLTLFPLLETPWPNSVSKKLLMLQYFPNVPLQNQSLLPLRLAAPHLNLLLRISDIQNKAPVTWKFWKAGFCAVMSNVPSTQPTVTGNSFKKRSYYPVTTVCHSSTKYSTHLCTVPRTVPALDMAKGIRQTQLYESQRDKGGHYE